MPTSPGPGSLGSWVKTSLGQPELAIERVARAIVLRPNDPQSFSFYAARAFAQLMAGHTAEAYASAEDALRERPEFLLYIAIGAASAALLGREADARKLVTRLDGIHPGVTANEVAMLFPLRRSSDLEHWKDGLRKAGLPD